MFDYCEVRYLSKDKMLKRFYDFMNINRKIINQIKDDPWVCDLDTKKCV